MTRTVPIAAAFVAALTAAAYSVAGSSPSISSTSIAGANRGLTTAAYKRLLGGPSHLEAAKDGSLTGFEQPEGWTRLVFPKRKLQIYFNGGVKSVVVTTWNKAYKTPAGIGPCSTVEQLKKAYGRKIRPSTFNTQQGNVYVYTMGDLLFAAANLTDVTAIGLYDSKAPGASRKGGSLSYAGFVILADQISCS